MAGPGATRDPAQLIAEGRRLLLSGDQAAADQLLAEASALFSAAGDGYNVAAQTGNYGWALRRAGRPEAARPYLLRAAELFRELGMLDYAQRHYDAAVLPAPPSAVTTLLAELPAAVREAISSGDSLALDAALAELPPETVAEVVARLEQAGLVTSDETGPQLAELLRFYEPLLAAIAAVAQGDETPRAQIEALLPELEENGWKLTMPVQAIWWGQRDPGRLTAGLDPNSAALVRRILELVDTANNPPQ